MLLRSLGGVIGVDKNTSLGMGVGISVGSGVLVGIAAERVCWTDNSTHICVAIAPTSGVGAGLGLGVQEINHTVKINVWQHLIIDLLSTIKNFEFGCKIEY